MELIRLNFGVLSLDPATAGKCAGLMVIEPSSSESVAEISYKWVNLRSDLDGLKLMYA